MVSRWRRCLLAQLAFVCHVIEVKTCCLSDYRGFSAKKMLFWSTKIFHSGSLLPGILLR
ncbi:hypothetical protein SynBMKMC1_01973 [Synechococcus sp. BMK-MC-1]|nr:hypothetical protein SynBMKMC1_01973 [Synechococcus sp. BMK-MC-1]